MKTITQTTIATLLGFKKSRFSRLLSGSRNLKYPDAKILAKKIGCKSKIWLLGGGTPAQRRAAVKKFLKG